MTETPPPNRSNELMVPEFDRVVFSAEVNQVHGPVKTQFGYHLIDITERTE